MIKVGVLTISDKGSRGEREDRSGPLIEELIRKIGGEVQLYRIVPDDRETISSNLVEMADTERIDLILTTGGTGVAKRDVTPEATKDIIEKEVPGIGEAMRMRSLEITDWAMLSRMTAGTRGETMIVNLPGSPKAVQECLGWIMSVIPHAVGLLKGEIGDHTAETKAHHGHE